MRADSVKAGRLMQAGDTLTLTTPEPEAEAHSLKCRRYIAERIAAAGGALSFAEFMQHALYAPGRILAAIAANHHA